MNNEKLEKLKRSLSAYRAATYPKDIEMFGEIYWKNKVLEKHCAYTEAGVEWADYYTEEISDGLDNNVSMLELAEVLINHF